MRRSSLMIAPLALYILFLVGCNPSGPTVIIEAKYPGTSARMIEETVACPIEFAINGVPGLKHMRSRSATDGRYTLQLVFEPGVKTDEALKNVQNRAAVVMPLLPPTVTRLGVTLKKQAAGIALCVKIYSPNGSFDVRYLSNYANAKVKDDLLRIAGVADVVGFGEVKDRAVVTIAVEKLAKYDLVVSDVLSAIEAQQLNVSAGRSIVHRDKSLELEWEIDLQRLADKEAVEKVILKVDGDKNIIRLKDIAKVEAKPGSLSAEAFLNGAPVVLADIFVLPDVKLGEVVRAVRQKLSELRTNLPRDMALDVAFDFTSAKDEILMIDVDLPRDASHDRIASTLARAAGLARKIDGVRDVMTRNKHPLERAACLVFRLEPADQRAQRGTIIGRLRDEFSKGLPAATFRVREMSQTLFPGGYPIDFAIHGPKSADAVRLAKTLAQRMRKDQKLIDVWVDLESEEPSRATNIIVDYERFEKHGFGFELIPTLQLVVPLDPTSAHCDEVRKLKIRNSNGKMIPLGTFVRFGEEKSVPAIINHFNRDPMFEITANPAPGEKLGDAKRLCEKLAQGIRTELMLPDTYRLSWLLNP